MRYRINKYPFVIAIYKIAKANLYTKWIWNDSHFISIFRWGFLSFEVAVVWWWSFRNDIYSRQLKFDFEPFGRTVRNTAWSTFISFMSARERDRERESEQERDTINEFVASCFTFISMESQWPSQFLLQFLKKNSTLSNKFYLFSSRFLLMVFNCFV